MNTYAGLIILICGFVLGDVVGFNKHIIRSRERKKRGDVR